MEEYTPAKEAAKLLGIEYPTLLARVRKGKMKAKKIGWAVLIHNDELQGTRNDASNKPHLAKAAG